MYKNLAAALTAACLSLTALAQSTAPVKAAWVYVNPLTEVGWTQQHDLGRRAAEKALGDQVKTTYVQDVPEGADAERVIRDLAQQGNQIIFTPSFGYMEPTLKVARDFPNVKFESITGTKRAPNVATANVRYYEGRYLAGIAAGRMTHSNRAGYVAGFAIPEVIQGINAFTLGMRSVNPKAEVNVIWLDEWFNPAREREAALTLINQGADVLAFHTGSTAVMSAAEERGKLAIAYHSDMRNVAPNAQILAITHQWGDYYTRRIKQVQDGTWSSTNLWGGVKEGMLRVEAFGPKVPAAVQNEVLARQSELASGRLHPFTGPLIDNTGVIRAARDSAPLDDSQILGMNWLVQGVNSSLRH
ncbi:MAG: BMP family ABC transporter substrate-binding protein [Burkholderiaceae bacterium]|jgi:simple sugar transport system substrate-binding protein|nr:BMP family ABC transporter substrate-binding protein [Burkholderiaceae bacterium]